MSCTDKNTTGLTGHSVVLAASIVGINHQRKQLLLIFTLQRTCNILCIWKMNVYISCWFICSIFDKLKVIIIFPSSHFLIDLNLRYLLIHHIFLLSNYHICLLILQYHCAFTPKKEVLELFLLIKYIFRTRRLNEAAHLTRPWSPLQEALE